MTKANFNAARVSAERFSQFLGIELVQSKKDEVTVKMPYRDEFGVGRIHGGAISSLVDVAATAAFWSDDEIQPGARGATVGFTINFLKLAVRQDLFATAKVRRRGGTLSTGNVVVTDTDGNEIAIAVVTYKLDRSIHP